jgi:hypothetical protein
MPSRMQILTALDMAMLSEAAEVDGAKRLLYVWIT